MLNIYYCLRAVSWKGCQGFPKGVVKFSFPCSIYQLPCNLGSLKYGQSACYSTFPGSSALSCFTQMMSHPPADHQAHVGTWSYLHDSSREGWMPGK